MKDISALMDGELDRRKTRSTIRRLEQTDDLQDAWATFHVIRDTLQGNAVGPSRFVERFHERLERESAPVVPRWRLWRPGATAVLLGFATLAAAVAVLIWSAGWSAWTDLRGRPGAAVVPAPFVDGGLNDAVAVEYAMAHRQLAPAFVTDLAAVAAAAAVPAAMPGAAPAAPAEAVR